MNVQMVYGLAAVRAGVHHHAIALRKFFRSGNLRRNTQQMAEQ
jgi:hypothetical protein